MPPRYKRSRPASSVAAGCRSYRSSTASPPSDSPPLPPFETTSPEQLDKYHKLSSRPILPNKFIDEDALSMVGLKDNVIEPLRRVGWGDFIAMKDPVYAPLTLEFLSSYSSLIRFPIGCVRNFVQFRLLGRDFELSIDELSHIFGFPTENAATQLPTDSFDSDRWNELTRETGYNPRISKASKLKSPALRYIHKFFVSTIFGRSESDRVLGQNELYFLWAIKHGVLLNVGYWLGQKEARVARADKGAITMGSFVTRIATYLRVWNPARPIYDSLSGGRGTRIDIDMMIHMRIVEKCGDSYRVISAPAETTDDDTPAAANIAEDQPPPAPGFSFGAGTFGAGPSFQGTSTVSNDEVLARMLSRMDVFDTRLTGMESMITDRFKSLEITQGSIDSCLDTMQGQLQTILHLLQPPPPPPPEA
ncbi:hypothetical protein JCGZ_01613 [Jatropha curcas]|uniref:Arabidopsis retrotransposon Orf1 C-terminal domain-containing protein n=1 Tax=Jatropha curcas TaxID=180498 RepID=A0A067LDZ6_JATCU|nr:hypothetical protein JCGZ_01613 [Jatropha curcas]